MRFLAPDRLWLLGVLAALAAGYLAAQRRRRRDAVRFSNLALLARIAPRRPGWRRHLPAAALLLALVALVVALARPARTEEVPRERATVVMAVDVSLSMQATDVTPNRLDAARSAAHRFVELLPDRFNLALVAFAGSAQLLVPPTEEHDRVRQAIDGLDLRFETAIGEAVFAGLDALRLVPGEPGREPPPSLIVLMSDGHTTTGRPNHLAAAAASDAGVPVTTIAFGTPGGTIVFDGQVVPVPVDRRALARIADQTGGEHFDAATAGELRRVYEGLGSELGTEERPVEVGRFFLGLGLVLAVLAAAGSLLWQSRLP